MKSVILLFLDHKISRAKAQRAFCAKFNSNLFDFVAEFKKQLEIKDELTNAVNSFIEKGEVIPIPLLEKLVANRLQTNSSDKIVMYGYPRSQEQYQSLERLFENLHISIKDIWFVKQREPERYLLSHYSDPKYRPWLAKFGSEVNDIWRKDFQKTRQMINSVMATSEDQNWHIVEMDYQSEITEQYIFDKITRND